MRVRINYAVEVENLIEEVQRLIEQAELKLHNQIRKLHRAREGFDEESISTVIRQVDLTRKELSRYDQTLEDCSSILQGYYGLLEQQKQGETDVYEKSEDG